MAMGNTAMRDRAFGAMLDVLESAIQPHLLPGHGRASDRARDERKLSDAVIASIGHGLARDDVSFVR
jgi:hypothetical protein